MNGTAGLGGATDARRFSSRVGGSQRIRVQLGDRNHSEALIASVADKHVLLTKNQSLRRRHGVVCRRRNIG